MSAVGSLTSHAAADETTTICGLVIAHAQMTLDLDPTCGWCRLHLASQ